MPIAPGAHVQAGAERSNVNGVDRLIQDRHSHWQCETGARQNGTSSFTPPFDPFPALETKRRGVFALFVPVLGTSFGGCRTQPGPRRHNRRFFWASIAAAQEERKKVPKTGTNLLEHPFPSLFSTKYGPDEADAPPQRTRFNSAETCRPR